MVQNWFAETTLLVALIKDVKSMKSDKVKTVSAMHKKLQAVTAYRAIPRSNLYRWFTLKDNKWRPTREFKENVRAGEHIFRLQLLLYNNKCSGC